MRLLLITLCLHHRLTRNENAIATANVATQGNFQPSNEAQFVCPITGQELNGRFRFSLLKCTGHVISERAIKQVRLLLNTACSGSSSAAGGNCFTDRWCSLGL